MFWVSLLEFFLLNPRCFNAQVQAQERRDSAGQTCWSRGKEKAVVSQTNTFSVAVVQSVLERLDLKKVSCQEKSTACFVWHMQAS